MASGQLVADTDLTLLGDVYLCHLQDARWQLVADGDGELATLVLCIEKLCLLQEVCDEL